jgi:hypothetical protein
LRTDDALIRSCPVHGRVDGDGRRFRADPFRAGAPESKVKAGFDLALASFEVDAAGKGTAGELAPAATIKMDANGALDIEDYGAEVVRLTGISKK